MSIFDKMFNKKKSSNVVKPEQYMALESFMVELNSKLESYCYLAKSDYSKLLKYFLKTYEYFMGLKMSEMLSAYVKKNKLDARF